jgi:hypothetical protein
MPVFAYVFLFIIVAICASPLLLIVIPMPVFSYVFQFIIIAICAGPLLPMTATLFVPNATPRRHRQNIVRLLYLSFIQAVTFFPYLYGLAFDRPEYGIASWIPVFPGMVLFVGTSIYAISEFKNVSTRAKQRDDA